MSVWRTLLTWSTDDPITMLKHLPEWTPEELGAHHVGHHLTQTGAANRHRALVPRMILTSIQYRFHDQKGLDYADPPCGDP